MFRATLMSFAGFGKAPKFVQHTRQKRNPAMATKVAKHFQNRKQNFTMKCEAQLVAEAHGRANDSVQRDIERVLDATMHSGRRTPEENYMARVALQKRVELATERRQWRAGGRAEFQRMRREAWNDRPK